MPIRKNKTTNSGFVQRREFIKTGGALLTAAIASPTVMGSLPKRENFPSNMLNQAPSDVAYGLPSTFEKDVVRKVTHGGNAAWTPIEQMRGIITPNGLHFGSHHSGVPDIDPETHEVYIHGMVDKPLKFNINQLLRYPMQRAVRFLECSGNSWEIAVSSEAPQKTAGQLHGLVSGAEWIGIPVKTLLEEAGVKPKAKWVIAEGADTGSLARSIPIEKMMCDAILAFYQNGERLRPAQGYPVRLFLPGWEGNTNIKWLRRLEVVDQPAFTKDESRLYTETLANGTIEEFSFNMDVKSVITHPSGGQQLQEKGFYEVAGIAWSGFGKIKKVEVSDDGGKTWAKAELQGESLSKSLTYFTLPWNWTGRRDAILMSRAFDEAGRVQPTRAEWKKIYHPGSYNHYNAIQAWHINKHGEVRNVYY